MLHPIQIYDHIQTPSFIVTPVIDAQIVMRALKVNKYMSLVYE
jgi:hypothetical protein